MFAPALVAVFSLHYAHAAAAHSDSQSARACRNLSPASGTAMVPGNIAIFPVINNPYNSPSSTEKEGV